MDTLTLLTPVAKTYDEAMSNNWKPFGVLFGEHLESLNKRQLETLHILSTALCVPQYADAKFKFSPEDYESINGLYITFYRKGKLYRNGRCSYPVLARRYWLTTNDDNCLIVDKRLLMLLRKIC